MPYKTAGFTLLELMVVLLIVGITISFAVISFGGDRGDAELKREAKRLTRLLQLAQDRAITQSRQYGLRVFEDGYRFYLAAGTMAGETWQPFSKTLDADANEGATFRDRTLAEGMQLQLIVEDETVENETALLSAEEDNTNSNRQPNKPNNKPHVAMLSTGEIAPYEFAIILQSENTARRYRITGCLDGRISTAAIDQDDSPLQACET